MRSGFLFLVAFAAAASAVPGHERAADHDLLKKQQHTIHLLEHITQLLPNQELHTLGLNYDIESHVQEYHEPTTVMYYVGMVKSGHVQPKGTVYSNSVSQLRKEVALLTRVLLSAKDYPVFLKTAAWARVHVNEQQFVKAYIAAILQREDTVGVILPPLYEIFPHHFIDSRVIQEAQNINIKHGHTGGETIVLPVNYTDYLPHGEHKLSYFTHDIGLNAYYAYVQLAGHMIPEHHLSGSEQLHGTDYEKGHHIGHGAYYYYLHQQLLARYNLNRLGTGLGPLQDIDYQHVKVPFQPHLHFANGLQLPGRPGEVHLGHEHHDLIKNIVAFEKRILNAIDAGHVITPQQQFLSLYQPQGLNILGDLISGTGRSINPRYYGSLQAVARQLLGNAPNPVNIYGYTPSALELGETCIRDPAFYQLYHRIVKLFLRYQKSLPAYQYDDLVLPGVKIEKVTFPELVTYADHFEVDLDGGYIHPEHVQEEQQHLKIKAQLKRLNHKQYEYEVVVNSEKLVQGAVVRVYLGPKYDHDGLPIDINHHRLLFVELDQFVHDLQPGKNVIIRNSQQSPIVSHDHPSVHQIKVHLDSAIRSQNPFYVTEPQQIFGFPARLSLPKGKIGGLPLQVLVVISSNQHVQVPHGPVIPAELQNYQHHQFQIVDGEHYEQHTHLGHQQVQGVHHGEHQTLEVLPHFHDTGIYGQNMNKLQSYFGHYFYKKYGSQYPIHVPHHVYGQGYQQQGVLEHGYHHQQPLGQQEGILHQEKLHHGQVLPGQIYQGQTIQGQQHEGKIHHGQYTQGQLVQGQYSQGPIVQGHLPQGQIHQGQLYGQMQGVQHPSVDSVNYPGIHHGQGIHTTGGFYPGVTAPIGLSSGIVGGVGGQQIVGGVHGDVLGQHHHTHDEHLKQVYDGMHISHIIGGAISLDQKPLGYPLNRPLAPSVFFVPNIHVADVVVHHVDTHIEVMA